MKTVINDSSEAFFNNNVGFCVGSGRMGLTLQKRFLEQLDIVQKHIGFEHIRCHGLFSDDMAIYHTYTDENGEEKAEYNFTYLDIVMDSYKKAGIKPFLELGFMPDSLASGKQTIFYWKGNVTPPKEYEKWAALVTATLTHLIERYGDEALTYPIEVWNEPNLPGFWEKADMKEYFRLYKVTAEAVKKAGNFKVGGPAICGVRDEEWMTRFLEFVRDEKAPLDFITRHHYTANMPNESGHYHYQTLVPQAVGMDSIKRTREIVDSFKEFCGMDIHITEFNTSYDPKCVIHDTNLNAAYVAWMLSQMGEYGSSYSYWTVGDIFEEQGVPFTPFHGGFGMVSNDLIIKPTLYAFEFFKSLTGKCVFRSDDAVVVCDNGTYKGVSWNLGKTEPQEFVFEEAAGKRYCLITKTVDENTCDPLKLWHDMGEKKSLSESEARLIREAAVPLVRSETTESGSVKISPEVNGVVYFEFSPAPLSPDRGYDYERVMSTGIEYSE